MIEKEVHVLQSGSAAQPESTHEHLYLGSLLLSNLDCYSNEICDFDLLISDALVIPSLIDLLLSRQLTVRDLSFCNFTHSAQESIVFDRLSKSPQ